MTRACAPPSLLSRHSPDDVVAFGAGGDRTASDLLRDAALVAQTLPPASEASEVLLVFRHDRYAFATALLAAWSSGHAVALPPNTRRESIWKVADRSEVVEILHDTAAGSGICVADKLARPSVTVPALAAPQLPDRERILTVYTSGSTQQPRPLAKSERQLLGEALTLASAFIPPLDNGPRVVGTVSPTHIYGLLFTVLLPLVSRGAFLRETLLHALPIAQLVAKLKADILVTVPIHLRGLGTVEPGSLGSLKRVFCSTAALPAQTAFAFVARHGIRITEIFGSSETGGIAWREQADHSAWRPLPGVELDVDPDGHLLVQSPFVATGSSQPYRTQDVVELQPDRSFVHQGRADGVVKIGGLRVSLPAMEVTLRQLDGVEDAAVVGVPGTTGRGTQALAAVVAPGWTAAALKDALSASFDHTCLPRRFVFAEQLPREDNGKLQHQRLLRMFGLASNGQPLRWSLDWGRMTPASEDGNGLRRQVFSLHVPQHYGWFEGHFPGYPILVAAVQLRDIVMHAIRQARPELGHVRQMRRLKFLERIQPNDDLDVELRWHPQQPSVQFALLKGGKTCSSGRVTCDEPTGGTA